MKNLSIGKKLTVGFGAVLALMLLTLGAVAYSVGLMLAQVDLYAAYTVPNVSYTWSVRRNLVSVERYMLEAMVADSLPEIQEALSTADADSAALQESLDAFAANQRDDSSDDAIAETLTQLERTRAVRAEITALISKGTASDLDEAYEMFNASYVPEFDALAAMVVAFSDQVLDQADAQQAQAQRLQLVIWAVMAAAAVLSVAVTVAVILAIRRSILSPVKEIERVCGEISKGNLKCSVSYESRDELGNMATLIRQANEMQSGIVQDLIEHLVKLSQGDLCIRVDQDYPGDFEPLKTATEETVSALHDTMTTIQQAAEQVGAGAKQSADGAQALAAGATEQAAAVEELSASVAQVARQAEENAEHVRQAARDVEETGEGIAAGNEHMAQLTRAMDDISSASAQIASITKAIEDIAFQTNILALNAAIEAARAGAAGRGFAVVAQEVRSLAGKSAEAAQKTGELLESSLSAVNSGTKLTDQTAQLLQEAGRKAGLVSGRIASIKLASDAQASAIVQVRDGLGQVSDVVQTNAATAEENSATSEEMSAQAAALGREVQKFSLKTCTTFPGKPRIAPLSVGQATPEPAAALPAYGKY